MVTDEIQTKVKQVISNVLKISADELSNDANFIFDLGADSMQSLELVAAFEEEFDIEMDQEKALEIQSVADAVVFIENCLN
ncbi:MAG: acyl carrier protein [Calditrichia bacterium]|nr:acyl carrier protein [Calditrichia bacterium]